VVREIRDVPPEETVRAADAPVVEDIRRELELGAGPTIVYTGNLDRRQGVEILVQAMAQVFRRIPDARLILVGGTDAEVARIRDLAESLGIGERVVLTGKRPTNLMPEYMALASVLASPRLEPLVTPLKIYAYMASGRPIVATDLPTHTQVLDESAAFLAAPTPEGFAAGIFDALSDPERATRRGLEARRLALTVHSYDSFKRQVLELYASVEKMRRSSSAREREAG
jgi:glycosyltransferase involved in cell wall biosynthesis